MVAVPDREKSLLERWSLEGAGRVHSFLVVHVKYVERRDFSAWGTEDKE